MPEKSFWTDDWMNLQRSYWDQWTRFQQQALGSGTPSTSPWQSAMDHWLEAVQASLPQLSREFLDKTMEQGKSFFHMAEAIGTTLDKGDTNAWSKIVEGLVDSFRQGTNGNGAQNPAAYWEMPLDNWNRLVSALAPVPGDMLKGMHTTGVRENLDRMLGAPGLGYTRESQEQYQSLSQAILEYQEALAEYNLFFTRMGEGAAQRLGDKFMEKPVESARDLYDSWVHCCEEEYATQVMTPEYLELHGRITNALMQVKSRWGELLDEYLSALNIPTQEDLRTLQRRVQEQRRELHALRREVSGIRKALSKGTAAPATKAAPKTKKKAVAKGKANTPNS